MTDIGFPSNSPLEQGTQVSARSTEPIQGIGRESRLQEDESTNRGPVDRVEISEETRELDRHLSALKKLPKVREEKIANARLAIEEGRLDTNEALSKAIKIMIDEAMIL